MSLVRLVALMSVAFAVLAGAGSAAAGAGESSAVGTRFIVTQLQFPSLLVVRGELVEVGYDAQRAPGLAEVPRASGTLFVRNDLQQGFTAVPLKLRWALQRPSNEDDRRLLRALVPQRLLGGEKLFYYAVIRDRRTGRSATVPAGGARAPEQLWIINDAFRVRLAHVFGHEGIPEAVVARAGPDEVGFSDPTEGGPQVGPWSFEVREDGSVWLLDQLDNRLLVWARGHPDAVARTVSLPFLAFDFAVGPAGSLYVTRYYRTQDPPLHGPGSFPPVPLSRLSAGGKVLWTSKLGTTIINTPLRTGPDGTLYWTSTDESPRAAYAAPPWVPAATPAGRPLWLPAQERRKQWTQPLPGGRQLVQVTTGWRADFWGNQLPHEVRLALVDRAGRVVRAWRVESRTVIGWKGTPALVGGDPVIVLSADGSGPWKIRKYAYLVLRLGPSGSIRTRFTLPRNMPWQTPDPRAAWGEIITTDIRVGPGAKLYQLGSSPDTGAAIYRYSLAPSG
jgi:hypothetical protein